MNAQRLSRQLAAWCLFVLLCQLSPVVAQERALDVAAAHSWPLSLTSHIGLLEDPSASLTLAEVQAPGMAARFVQDQPPGNALGLGFTRSAFWLRLVLRNSSDVPVGRMLVVNNPRVSHVHAYLPDEQGVYHARLTGSDAPPGSKAYANRNFVFPISVPAGAEQVLYLRVQSTVGLLVPLQLWSQPAFHAYERDDYMARAWYFGIATAMILFNLMLFVALRQRIYMLYVSFVTCTLLALVVKNGMAPDWSLAGVPLNANVVYYSLTSLALAAMLQFMRRMLRTEHSLPRTDRVLQAVVLLYLLTPLLYVLALPLLSRAAILLNLATAVLAIGVGLACAWQRQRSAYFFLGAFSLLMLGGASATLRAMGLLPTNAFTEDGLLLGSSLEMLLLAFALADRYNLMRQEKERVREELLSAQQLLVQTLQRSERELEQRVAQRTDELQVLNNRLETLSLTDALTGIANRRHFDDVLAREWARAQRSGDSLALAVLDVDWFKRYNDHYGHPAGDRCLRQVAQTLAATVGRGSDLVARYGGEEFVFLAPMTPASGAEAIAQRLVSAVESLDLPHSLSPFGRITISVGVAVTTPGGGETPDSLLQQADAALYQAKQQGRNQAVCG